MRFSPIYYSALHINFENSLSKITDAYSVPEFIDSIKQNLTKPKSDFIRALKYSETYFLVSKFSPGKYTIMLMDSNIASNLTFDFEPKNYGSYLWRGFPPYLCSICTQMIIFQVHNS